MRSLPCPICDDNPERAGETCAHEPREPTGTVAAYLILATVFFAGVLVGVLMF